jgi:flagellar hook-associated protein 1 FlgK
MGKIGLDHSVTGFAQELKVHPVLSNDNSRISRGLIQYDISSASYFVAEGDNTIAQQLADLMAANQYFSRSGGIPAGTMSLSEYATSIISAVANKVTAATGESSYQASVVESLEYKSAEISAVDMDEEYALLIVYERSYVAASKVINTANEMLDTLMNLI